MQLDCSPDTGCCVSIRTEVRGSRDIWPKYLSVAREFEEEYDEEADGDYVDEEIDENEDELEYDSGVEIEGAPGDVEMLDVDGEEGFQNQYEVENADEEEGGGAEDEQQLPYCEDYITLLRHLGPHAKDIRPPSQFYPLLPAISLSPPVRPTAGKRRASLSLDDLRRNSAHQLTLSDRRNFDDNLWAREESNYQVPPYPNGEAREVALAGVEHIAGPDCNCDRGYNGYRVSAEEMKGCCNYQCLVTKGSGWKSEGDDFEFEREGKFALSGIGDRFPSRDMDYPSVVPARHGWERITADTTNYIVSLPPFHISFNGLSFSLIYLNLNSS